MKPLFLFALVTIHGLCFAQLQSIANFGSNPGNLNAYHYVPANMPADAPLVVVMHGCTQNAANFSNETGWNTLADFHKFYVVYAEQKSANNTTNCFNYWETGDHSRGQGEARSIKQMVDYMKSQYSIDSSRVFATGLSAGGAMTCVMLSAYPDVFAAGAEMAGLPYKVATSSLEVYTAALGLTSKSPQEWGNLVRGQYPGFSGSYPRMAIFHGTSDIIINENNAEETMKQFTNLHSTDQVADFSDGSFAGNSLVELNRYHNANGDVVVERYTFDNMAHGIAVDPGSCFEQGGGTGSNAIDVNFYSSFYAAKFFGILRPPFAISGLEVVTDSAAVNYTVTGNSGSDYDWEVEGGGIAGGQGTNSINVAWTDTTGVVRLTETTSAGCVLGPVELAVLIQIEEPIDTTEEPIDTTEEPIDTTTTSGFIDADDERIFISETNGRIYFNIQSAADIYFDVAIHNLSGQRVYAIRAKSDMECSTEIFVSGIYFVRCASGEKIFSRKVVVR